MFGSGSLCLSRVGFGMVGRLCQVCRYVSNACGGAVIIEWGGQCSLLRIWPTDLESEGWSSLKETIDKLVLTMSA